jgi:3'(2'), 5'-bisphosphate nucleotidase
VQLSSPEINAIIKIAQESAHLIMGYYNSALPEAERKSDNSPVTIADKHASEYIIAELAKINASIPVVSEENKEEDNIAIIKKHQTFWLIDPIDGTWSFIRKKGEFTVNIALIVEGQAVWGLIANPQDGAVYYMDEHNQCIKLYQKKHLVISGKDCSDSGLDFLVSHQNLNQRIQDYIAQFPVKTITPIPSSLKFALMAEGKGDIYPRFKRTCIWDTAAGHALLTAIGGGIYKLSGEPLNYNSGILENPDFIAVSRKEILKEKSL